MFLVIVADLEKTRLSPEESAEYLVGSYYVEIKQTFLVIKSYHNFVYFEIFLFCKYFLFVF